MTENQTATPGETVCDCHGPERPHLFAVTPGEACYAVSVPRPLLLEVLDRAERRAVGRHERERLLELRRYAD